MKKFVLLILLFCSCKMIAQESQESCKFYRDTMYFVTLNYLNIPSKGPPQTGHTYVKDLPRYKISFANYNEMVNSFFTNAFFSLGWESEFYFFLRKCYKDSLPEIRDSLINDFYNKTIGLPKKYEFKSKRIFLPDSTSASITVCKMIAEFTKVPISERSFSTLDLKYDFKSYQYDYFYRFRRIIKFCTFSKEEKKALRKVWDNGNGR